MPNFNSSAHLIAPLEAAWRRVIFAGPSYQTRLQSVADLEAARSAFPPAIFPALDGAWRSALPPRYNGDTRLPELCAVSSFILGGNGWGEGAAAGTGMPGVISALYTLAGMPEEAANARVRSAPQPFIGGLPSPEAPPLPEPSPKPLRPVPALRRAPSLPRPIARRRRHSRLRRFEYSAAFPVVLYTACAIIVILTILA